MVSGNLWSPGSTCEVGCWYISSFEVVKPASRRESHFNPGGIKVLPVSVWWLGWVLGWVSNCLVRMFSERKKKLLAGPGALI